MSELRDYSGYLLKEKFESLSTLFNQQVKDRLNGRERKNNSLLHEDCLKQMLNYIRTNQFPAFMDEITAQWKKRHEGEMPEHEDLFAALVDLMEISKISMIKFLRTYPCDLEKGVTLMEQIAIAFDSFMKKVFAAYQEMHKERIAEEKELIETVLDSTVEGITGIDKNMRITIWNKALELRTGIKKEQIVGAHLADFFPENARGFELDIIKEAQSGRKVHFESIPLKWRKGFYDIDILPLRNRHGEVVGSLSFSRDVSEKVEAMEQLKATNKKMREKQRDLNRINEQLTNKLAELEKAQSDLKRQSQFIQSILSATPDFITVFNLRSRKNIFLNRSVKEYLGYENNSEEEGMDFMRSIIHPDDMPVINSFLNGFDKNHHRQTLEYRVKDRFGNYRWIRGRYNTLWKDPDGKPMEVVGLTRDITDEKSQQRRIEEALNHYLKLLEDFPAMIWRSGSDAQPNYFNQTWVRFTGVSADQQKGDGWKQSVHPEDLDHSMEMRRARFNARESFEMEYRLLRHDGVYRWVMDFGKPIYGLEGEFIGYLGACFDIQDRKDYEVKLNDTNQELAAALEELQSTEEQLVEMNSELERKIEERTRELKISQKKLKKNLKDTLALNQELANRESFLASIVEQTPVSTWVSDHKGMQVKANQAYFDLFNITKNGGQYNILEDKSLQKEPFFKEIKAVYEKGDMARFTMQYEVTEDADPSQRKIIYLNVSMFPIKNKAGKIMNVVMKHEDITDRVKAEIALKDNEEQMRTITNAIPALIAYYDNDLTYQFVNQLYTEWFDKKREDFIGKHVSQFIGKGIQQMVTEQMNEALKGKMANYESEVAFPNSKIGSRNMMITYVPRKVNGKVIGFFALGHDITQLKKFQNQLIDKNKELVRINNDLDNFVYTASHDLKSPIVNLEGLILALKRTIEDKLSPRETKLLTMMNKSVSKLKETIDYLGDATKAVSFEEKSEQVSIPGLVKSVKADIKHLIKEADAEIRENYEIETINFVRGTLKSIFYNLLSNAIKYRSPERPLKIEIKTYAQESYTAVSVTDNGLGLSPNQQSKLFTMFKRMHKHVEGSGIGLYILKRMVENVNGKIIVESQENIGSTFKVLIPVENGKA